MKKLLIITFAFFQISLLTSCSLIQGVNDGIAIVKGVNDRKAVVKSKVEEMQAEARNANQRVVISNESSSSNNSKNTSSSTNNK